MDKLLSRQAVDVAMPQGTRPLFLIQIVATLSFSVLYSTLVLYMKGKLGISATTANSIMGVFVAFNFGLHLLGGYWGGRLFSNRGLFAIGMLAQVIGCALLAYGSETSLYYGLSAFLTGSGLNVTCLNCMLTQLFKPDDPRRETAFLWNYAGMNLGFFLGFSMSGYFQLTQNYVSLFLLSSLGNIIALMILFYYWSCLADQNTRFAQKQAQQQQRSNWLGLTLIFLMPWGLSHLLHHAEMANQLVLVTGALMIVVLIVLAYQQPVRRDRDRMLAFTALICVSTIFWVLSQLAPMGMTHFIDNNVQRQFGQWIIPPQWFQNINTFTIVIGGPMLGWLMMRLRNKGYQVNIPSQFALALFCAGLAMLILPFAIDRANAMGMVSPGWIVLTYFLQSVGELLINPIGYAMIGFLAPASLQGAMMGMWLLNIGVGSTLASYCSNWMTAGQDSVNPLLTNEGYSDVFTMLGWVTLAVAILLYLMIPRLRVLMQENAAEEQEKLAVV